MMVSPQASFSPPPNSVPIAETREAIVRFEGVEKAFNSTNGPVIAVRDLNLSVYRGEILTVVGPSGCGKSTILNMTAGLFAPTNGTVRYAGDKVDGPNRKTGYMTQKDHLLPWRTVEDNISVPLEIRGWDRKKRANRIAELTQLVGLAGFEKAYPSQLSGGMRKRTALARLLAYDPETLLLDEPFAALDPQLRAKMQSELVRLCRTMAKTVIFVTHDLDEAVALGDRCAVFTPRPGTIREIVDVPLPSDRNILRLRNNETFTKLAARLWDIIVPEEGEGL
ncbi:ABC transporter ATP-binding protein [Mesorhizobium sp. YR577]|uniref:ABC transporter ATP-binding protein n=1 Tax=Mesorhizobium sp. YR577 TaxID=1884373 RepID=UPI0008EA3000|nr:ABC transporter ATP-binding protein [Mesorhizobium sp. YR577]SFU11593.1 NitT/TauT family transport system ATP-binding protein [Mesorhizobium sp. YR577]